MSCRSRRIRAQTELSFNESTSLAAAFLKAFEMRCPRLLFQEKSLPVK
jgi:hypothetical protein